MLPRALLLLLLLLAGTVPVSKFIAHIYACCLPCCAVLLTQRCSSVVHYMCGASHVWYTITMVPAYACKMNRTAQLLPCVAAAGQSG